MRHEHDRGIGLPQIMGIANPKAGGLSDPLHQALDYALAERMNDDRIIGNILSGSDALVTFNASGKQPICLTLISDPQWLVMAVLDQCFGDYPGTKLGRAVLGHNYVVE